MRKKIPAFKTNEEAERFMGAADLSKFDFCGLKPARFEFEKKSAQLNMRVPKALLEAVKQRSAIRGIPYTRLIRETVEPDLSPAGNTR
jgi:predicted DNA binding CopG/RHH family protein